ncbi:hypothetical protein DID88_010252, partial [Monilinia fructigena]
ARSSAATQKAFGTDAKAGLAYGAAPANQLVPSGSQGQGPARNTRTPQNRGCNAEPHKSRGYTPDYEMGAMKQSGLCAGELEMIHLSRKRNASSPSVAVSPELIISPVTRRTGSARPEADTGPIALSPGAGPILQKEGRKSRSGALQRMVEPARQGYDHCIILGWHRTTDTRLALNGPQPHGIEGNEAADELANTGANEGRTDDDRSAEPTISGIGTTAKALADIATSDWWSQCHPGLSASYRRWKLGYSVTEPPELRLPRTVLHRLLATRTAHGDFAQYHRRFGHTEASSPASAGSRRLPTTSYSARSPKRKFHAWPARPERPRSRPEEGRRYLSALLAHPELFENFLAVTQYFAINARAQRTRDQTIPGVPI